jgi:hypothetical protein
MLAPLFASGDDDQRQYIEPASGFDPCPQFIVRPKSGRDEEVQVTLATLENHISNIDVKLMQTGAKYTAGEFFCVLRVFKAEDTTEETLKNTLYVNRLGEKPKAMPMEKFKVEPPAIEVDNDEIEVDHDEIEVDFEG